MEHSYSNLRKWVQAHIDSRQQDKLKNQLQRSQSEQPHSRAAASVGDRGAHVPKKQSKSGTCWQFLNNNGRCNKGDKCALVHDYERLKTFVPNKGKGGGRRSQSAKGKGKGKDGGKDGGSRPPRSPRSPSAKGKGKSKKGTYSSDSIPQRTPRSPGRQRAGSKSGVRGSLEGDKYVPAKTRQQSRGRSPSNEKDRPPCQAFLDGKCKKGSECREWHVADCKYFKNGSCLAGNRCIFVHRDKNGNVINMGRANTAKPKRKAKAKAQGKAGTCISLEAHASSEIPMPLEIMGIPKE